MLEKTTIIKAYFSKKPKPLSKLNENIIHIVKKGDTLIKIAKLYRIDNYNQIKKDNNLKSDTILVNQKLKINNKLSTKNKESSSIKKSAFLGEKVYLIVEYTGNIEEIKVQIREKTPILIKDESPLPVIQIGNQNLAPMANYSPDTEVKNITLKKPTNSNNTSNTKQQFMYTQIALRPLNNKIFEDWKNKISSGKTDLWLQVNISAYNLYSPISKKFLNNKGEFFELKNYNYDMIDAEYFFDQYQKQFGKISEKQKNSLKKIFEGISDYYKQEKRSFNLKHIAYMLATAKHETNNTYDPVEEYYWGKSWDIRKKYFEKMYDPVLGESEKRKTMAKQMGNTSQGDSVKYFGRGFVQLTWKSNYQKMKNKFDIDFVDQPELALEHSHAIKIMIHGSEKGIFTGKSLADYINETKTDYYNARKVINGLDKAEIIKEYAEKIEKCLRAANKTN